MKNSDELFSQVEQRQSVYVSKRMEWFHESHTFMIYTIKEPREQGGGARGPWPWDSTREHGYGARGAATSQGQGEPGSRLAKAKARLLQQPAKAKRTRGTRVGREAHSTVFGLSEPGMDGLLKPWNIGTRMPSVCARVRTVAIVTLSHLRQGRQQC